MSVYRLFLSEFDLGLVAINSRTQAPGALLHRLIDSLFKFKRGCIECIEELFRWTHLNSTFTVCVWHHENMVCSNVTFKISVATFRAIISNKFVLYVSIKMKCLPSYCSLFTLFNNCSLLTVGKLFGFLQ